VHGSGPPVIHAMRSRYLRQSPELADDPDFRRRFRREVSALMRVRGLCTVRVIEADTESPRPFMVTEYAEGPSLAEYIDSYGLIGPDMLYGLAEALTVIHAAGIVHRDFKPSNVILTRAGPKVIDFATSHGNATVITNRGAGAWLSTDSGAHWTPVTVPVDHGAQNAISGVSFDGAAM
jgi:serine/threonine protein kinase